jgi:hypothetical protein
MRRGQAVESEMKGTARGIRIGVVAAIVLAMTAASAAATHTSAPQKPERPPPQPSSVQQEPEKRQNFRARRADEFPPWEGFEDCPMAFPCVGAVNPY